jgi:hypothetical protein
LEKRNQTLRFGFKLTGLLWQALSSGSVSQILKTTNFFLLRPSPLSIISRIGWFHFMSPSTLPAVVGHLSKKRGYPNANSASGLEPSLEANPPLNQCIQSQTSGHKRHKSVAFSAVDIIFVATSAVSMSKRRSSHKVSCSPASRRRRHSTAAAGPFESTPRAWYDPAYKRQHTDATTYTVQRHTPIVDTTQAYCRQRSSSNATPYKPPYENSGSLSSSYTVASHAIPSLSLCHTAPYLSITKGSRERRFSGAQLAKSVFPPNQNNYLSSIPVDVCALTQGSNVPPPARLPAPQFRSEVNRHVRETLGHHSFDFAKHIKHRSYVVRSLGSRFTSSLSSHECAAMLDEEVYKLLPSFFRTPPGLKEGNVLIKKVPKKGLGMFAQKSLRSGDFILSEHPVLVTPYVMAVGISVSEMYQQMFLLLSKPMRHQVLDLAVSAFPGGVVYGDEQDVHKSIIRINTFAINLPVPKTECAELSTHRGIFVNMSRCNHRFVPTFSPLAITFLIP